MQERIRERIPLPYQTPSSCVLLIKLLVIILSRIYSEIVLGPNLVAAWEQIQVHAALRDTQTLVILIIIGLGQSVWK